jgi:hypothetical protein
LWVPNWSSTTVTCSGQQSGQRRKHRPIRPGQSWPTHLAAQHRDLVAQHENFRILRVCAGQDLPEDQVQQSYRPATIMPDGHGPVMPQVTGVDDQSGTHRFSRRLTSPALAVSGHLKAAFALIATVPPRARHSTCLS